MKILRIGKRARVPIAKVLIGVVAFFNLQCAILFFVFPGQYVPSFELSGVPGNLMLQALGLLFLMWNVPYLFALADPVKYKVSLVEAIIMQGIGLVGESSLLAALQPTHEVLSVSIYRFILFDGAGLVFLILAGLMIAKIPPTVNRQIDSAG